MTRTLHLEDGTHHVVEVLSAEEWQARASAWATQLVRAQTMLTAKKRAGVDTVEDRYDVAYAKGFFEHALRMLDDSRQLPVSTIVHGSTADCPTPSPSGACPGHPKVGGG